MSSLRYLKLNSSINYFSKEDYESEHGRHIFSIPAVLLTIKQLHIHIDYYFICPQKFNNDLIYISIFFYSNQHTFTYLHCQYLAVYEKLLFVILQFLLVK